MFSKIARTVFVLTFALSSLFQTVFSQQKDPPREYTSEEKAKLKQAEAFADKFVRRWHETLDLNVLFDELYSSDPWIRELNIRKFCDCYDFLVAEASGTCVQVTLGLIGAETKRKGFMAFWNLMYLRDEYSLAYSPSADADAPEPKEYKVIDEEFEKFKEKYYGDTEDTKRINRGLVKNFVHDYILLAEKSANVYRKYLTGSVFDSEIYKRNRKLADAELEPSYIKTMPPEWRLEKGRPVFCVQRGLFELYLIEENGEFRVLTFGYEL